MSFLNPVNEPVLRFKSTDAGAPQINYNARVAGDVKAVLKACLVTGYGATSSAGWSVVNEVDHVAEFVSPSAAMIDYRLCVNDTSADSTTWYYFYKNSRTNPAYNATPKGFGSINSAHADNGWQLFVTQRGVIFVEIVYSTAVNKLSARMTYLSQVKSALVGLDDINMMFFTTGHSAAAIEPEYLYSPSYTHLKLSTYTSVKVFSGNVFSQGVRDYAHSSSVTDVISALYLAPPTPNMMIGEITGLLSKTTNNIADMYNQNDTTVNGRPAFSLFCGYQGSTPAQLQQRGRAFLIYLDYWEY